jgi:uracil-DNA glycosylase
VVAVELDEQGRALYPRAHADTRFLAAKRARIDEPHVARLNDLVRGWREPANVADPLAAPVREAVPWFDPAGGGTAARVLILAEAPGPKSVEPVGSGIISPDNSDPSADAVHAAHTVTGLSRGDCVHWNIVPWVVYKTDEDGDRTDKWTTPKWPDVNGARPALQQLLDVLPDLRVVITMGDWALKGWSKHLTLSLPDTFGRTPVSLHVPHPSQRNTFAKDEALTRLNNAFTLARREVDGSDERRL